MDSDDFESLLMSKDCYLRYFVFQKEVAESGTPHFQGYLETVNKVRFTAVKNCLGIPQLHLEQRKGTRLEAVNYCRKDETRAEGEIVHEYPYVVNDSNASGNQGKRSDLKDAAKQLLDTRDLCKVAEDYPTTFIRYAKGFQTLLFVTAPKRTVVPRVILLYGATGLGKTRHVHEHYRDVYFKAPDTRWFDGYNGQMTLCLDDYAGAPNKMSLSYILQLLDRYPFMLEVKGGYTPLLAQTVVITTNIHPKKWFNYENRLTQYDALARRISEVYWYPPLDLQMNTDEGRLFLDKRSFFDYWEEGCDEYTTFVNITPVISVDESMDVADENLEDAQAEAEL